ncbi:VCBS repeat-containing protein [Nannocystis sp. SCPEA4]|uniref:FG-GAP repeat domain-containing protein n=1 Tax=Nannocystis sp. SCPEA4 TaxID=2996787 RepID=UPI002270A5D7|nr:VCBS repeat-containing protein [Nannocystis sp. SCPEA4]
MVRLRRLVACLLAANAACIFPLSSDPTATESDPDEDDDGTTAVDPTTAAAPTTGADPATTTSSSTDTGIDDTGSEPQPTGWPPDDDRLEPILTEVWEFEAMDLGDVDGDGRLDLVTSGTGYPPRVDVYPGLGDGSFVDRDAAVVTELFGFSRFVLGDVDGDGRSDVLAYGTGFPPRVTVYTGDAGFGFTELGTTDLFESTHMHAGDLTGDGRADLVIGKGDSVYPWLQVWPGTPAGLADAPIFEAQPWAYDLLRSGDVDGDGRIDVVTASAGYPPQIYVHAGDGAGGFGEPEIAQIWQFSMLDVGDIDGDGRADVASDIPNNAWRFQHYRSLPDGWAEAVTHEGYTFDRLELGDVDGDGCADLVVRATGYPARIAVYLASTF